MEKIGLIAGSDRLPVVFAENAAGRGKQVVAICFKGCTSPDIEKKAKTYWLESVRVAEIAQILRSEGITHLVLEGKLPRAVEMGGGGIDSGAARIIESAENRQGQTLLGDAAGFLTRMGITVLDARTFLEDIVCRRGCYTARRPDERESEDLEFGRKVLKKIVSADVGQSIVVKNRLVLAVEAVEGTDEAIRRGALLGGGDVVVVKMSKPEQDTRFDIPVVGVETVETMRECGARVLAVEAGSTFMVDEEETVGRADRYSIAIVGV